MFKIYKHFDELYDNDGKCPVCFNQLPTTYHDYACHFCKQEHNFYKDTTTEVVKKMNDINKNKNRYLKISSILEKTT